MIVLFIYQTRSDDQLRTKYSNIGTELIYDLNDKSIAYHYLYLIYNNQSIEKYFLISGHDKNKIKFEDVSPKMLKNLENHLMLIKSGNGVILFKTTEYCLKELIESKSVIDLFLKENGACNRFSTFENLGNTSFVFWYKKLYYTFRDFVDWL